MEEFQVAAAQTDVLSASHLVEEMIEDAQNLDIFPVLIGQNVAYFHDIEGGYNRDGGYHVLSLVHEVQGERSPSSHDYAKAVEVHLDDSAYYLEIDGVYSFGEYPDEDYTLCLKVTGYNQLPYTFSDQLQRNIDKREEEISYDE